DPNKYRSNGIPSGITIRKYGPTTDPETVSYFRREDLWTWKQLMHDDPGLARLVAAQGECLVLMGKVTDPPSLNYFRYVVGLLTFLLDNRGVAIFDPFAFMWWSPTNWRNRVFDFRLPAPRHHVFVMFSEEAGGTLWYHTRGMRKFGRPDLSIHKVTPS